MWATDQTIEIIYSDITQTSYSTTEVSFTKSGISFGYINAMKNNANGTPTGWAKDQVIQTKSGGYIYNKSAISGLKNIRVYIVANTNSFTVTSGTSSRPSTNSVTRPSTATGTQSVTYTKYENKKTTANQTTTASYYDFAVNNDYFQIAPGGSLYIWKIVLTYGDAPAVEAPTFYPTAGTYTSTQNVTLACETGGTTIYYTTDGTTPTSTSTQYTGAISVSTTTTIKAIAKKGDDYSSVSTATYTILPVTHAGTEADPFTVTDARNALTAGETVAATGYYVTGYVAQKNTINNSGQMNYWISDDGGMTTTIQCYKGKYIDGADFTDSNAPAVGDLVVVKGKLTIYQSSTYEFTENNEVVSITPKPAIAVSKTTLEDFTYDSGNGPSVAQTFSVSGTTLSANITLSLGASSNYEMSLAENSGYTNELTLTPTTGTVAATTIYVRLKAGLAVNAAYEGTITLTSTDATTKTVTLAGSVTNPVYTFDLSTDQTVAATISAMNWIGTPAVMGVAKGSATTNTNNYYPGTSGQSYTSTRFYKNSVLTITPISGYTISSVVFEATTEGYATALKNSSWTNATAAASTTTVTVTPTTGTAAISATIGGTCGFTTVKVYYTGTTGATETITLNAACTNGTKYYGTYSTSKAFVVPTDMTVAEISVITGELVVEEYNAGAIVPANTGIMVSSATSGNHTVYLASGGASVLGSDNMLKPSGDAGILAANMTVADTKFYRLTMHDGTKLGFWWGAASGAAFDLAAHKAYLAIPNTAMASREGLWIDGDVTAIEAVKTQNVAKGEYFNLAGQRVAQPQKGLYIVNGSKVVIK